MPTRPTPIKAVLVCQNETATGVTSDIAAIRNCTGCGETSRAAVPGGFRQRAGQHRFPDGEMTGAWTSASAAHRRG